MDTQQKQFDTALNNITPQQKSAYTAANPNIGVGGVQQTFNATTGGYAPITPKDLSNVNPLQVPTTTGTVPSTVPTVPSPTGTEVDANGNATIPPPTGVSTNTTQAGTSAMDWIRSQFKTAGDTLATKSAVTTQLQNDLQLAAKTEQATKDYNAYNQKKLQYQQQIDAMYTKTGGTTGGIQQEVADYSRKANADLANLAIQAQVSQGLLSAAQQTIKDKIEAQFQPIQEQIDFLSKFSQLNNNDLTESQKFQLTQKENQKKTDLANLTKTADDLHQNMLQNGAPQSVFTALDQITNDYVSGKITATDAQSKMYRAVGDYGVSLQDRKTKQDISNAVNADATVSPDVLQGMLNVYKSTGTMPPFGLSAKSPLRAQFFAALGAEGGRGIVDEATQTKAVKAGLTTAIRTQQNQLAANQTAIGTLDKQLELAKQYSDKVSRSSSPLIAKYILATKSGVFGDADTAALNNIVTTASYEFAKILSGSAASVAGATVSSAEDAKTLLNSAMSRGQFNEVLNLMKTEANYRLTSQKETLNNLQKDFNSAGNLSSNLTQSNTIRSRAESAGYDYQAMINAGHTEAEIDAALKQAGK